ncbi:hypothetical protein A6R79_13220 [Xanthomonas translucens pv. translucens]|nr:hypothetical protein A6R79_13220 [Xanthomonas translucens pv. translucens]
MERLQPRIPGLRRLGLARTRQVAQAPVGGRQGIGGDRDQPVVAAEHGLRGAAVVAAEHGEAVAAQGQQRGDALRIAAGVLDADDVRMLRQVRHRVRQQVAAGAPGHVVQHHRQAAVLGHLQVVREQAGLGRAHVRRRHHQRVLRAVGGGTAGQRDRPGGAGQAGAGQQRHACADELRRFAQDQVVLLVQQRGRLAGRSRHHHALHAGVQLAFEQPLPGVEVEVAIAMEGRGQGGDDAGEGQDA